MSAVWDGAGREAARGGVEAGAVVLVYREGGWVTRQVAEPFRAESLVL
jgi:hypothetical protein